MLNYSLESTVLKLYDSLKVEGLKIKE